MKERTIFESGFSSSTANAAFAGSSAVDEPVEVLSNCDHLISVIKKKEKVHLNQITVRLSPNVLEFIKRQTRRNDLSIAEFIRGCLDHALSCDKHGAAELTPALSVTQRRQHDK